MCPPSKEPEFSLLNPVIKKEFTVVGTDIPHFARRKAILEKYPEIKELYGPDIRLLPSMLSITIAQVLLSIYATRLESWGLWVVLAWTLGGLLTHWLSLGNHELSHNLCFSKTIYNEILGMVANCAQAVPSTVTFKRYHLEHHYKQGWDKYDVDVPTEWEGRFFNNSGMKIIFIFLQPLFYSIRPLVVNPKPLIMKEVANFALVIGFDLILGYYFGYKAPLFNLVSTLLGMGWHFMSGHFLSEHYTFALTEGQQETFSYYGPLNIFGFNVGYHNEHHDFPLISGFRLPEVKKIAPEYYESLAVCESWPKTLIDFVVRPDMGPCSRVKRNLLNPDGKKIN